MSYEQRVPVTKNGTIIGYSIGASFYNRSGKYLGELLPDKFGNIIGYHNGPSLYDTDGDYLGEVVRDNFGNIGIRRGNNVQYF